MSCLVGGCGYAPSPLANLERIDSGGSSAELVGDWNDAYAAANLAISESEMASLEEQGSDREGRWVFTLTTIEGEDGRLELNRLPKAEGQPARVGATVIIGQAGDRDREARLLERVRDRLTRLAGKDSAPIDSPMGIPQ